MSKPNQPPYRPWPIKHLSYIPYQDFWQHANLFYAYQKLETASSFRLLKLERIPDDKQGRHFYTIVTTNFESAPEYETLSYVWGTTERNVPISLQNGKLLRITQPLKDALDRIETYCSTGYLWIDQICIDQDDSAERGHQVRVMGQIYSSCLRVIVWLGVVGQLDADNAHPIDAESSISPGSKPPPKALSLGRLREKFGSSHRKSLSLTQPSAHEYLDGLLSPWFQRAWVFQEIVLPPKQILIMKSRTTDEILTATLKMFHNILVNNAQSISDTNFNVSIARNMFYRWEERQNNQIEVYAPIEETLSLLAPQAQTSEELDHLYAFFGLNLNPLINLKPTYGLTYEEAMVATATSIIFDTRCLDIFEVIPRVSRIKNYDRSSLPSWTPDFRVKPLVVSFPRSSFDFRSLPRAPYDYETKQHYDTWQTLHLYTEFRPVLYITGYHFDYVHTELFNCPSETITKTELDSLLGQCSRVWKRIKKDHDKYEQRPSILGDDFAPLPDKWTIGTALSAGTIMGRPESPEMHDYQVLDFEITAHKALRFMRGRRLWMTSSGHLIIGSHLRKGDSIIMAYGASNPVAIREVHDVYVVLGTVFLEGWMDPWSNGKAAALHAELERPGYYHIR